MPPQGPGHVRDSVPFGPCRVTSPVISPTLNQRVAGSIPARLRGESTWRRRELGDDGLGAERRSPLREVVEDHPVAAVASLGVDDRYRGDVPRRRDRFLAPPPPGAFRLLAFAAGGMASAHVHLDDHGHPREEGA
jgi:hypothetical protein